MSPSAIHRQTLAGHVVALGRSEESKDWLNGLRGLPAGQCLTFIQSFRQAVLIRKQS